MTGAGLASAAVRRHAEPILRTGQSVRICHATGNGGFVIVEPAVDNNVDPPVSGHHSHERDIIPPFEYTLADGTTGHFDGHNWSPEGQAIWNNGCVRPLPPTGQIHVFVACVDAHGATYDATFGYTSASNLTIAVGSDNRFSPGDEDRGQVTTFNEGTVLHAFRVTGIPSGEEITWSVASGGSTSSDTASANFGLPCTDPPSPEPDVSIGVFVTCVVNHGSTYDAVFGYESENAKPESVPIGEANFFSPAPEGRGQPTLFMPGRSEQAVSVTGIPDAVELTWTLGWTDTRSATATAAFETKCGQPVEPPPPGPAPELPRPLGIFATCVTKHGSSYDATFGYVNENVDVVSIPIGEHNVVSPGPAGQGQPDVLHPGFVDAAFTVHGVSTSHAVTWTVRFGGQVRVAQATASLPNCLTAPIDPVAGAAVRKTATPRTVATGQRVVFTIVVRNTGSKILQPAQVSDTLSGDKLQILSATSTLGQCGVTTAAGSHRVLCSTPTFAPGQSFTIHIAARATASGAASDHAGVVGLPRSVVRATVHISGPPPVTG